jgi:outer membrane protein assembly factor BamB
MSESWKGAYGMGLHFVCAALSVLLLRVPTRAQLPPTRKLSVEDEREFNEELARLKSLLRSANNRPAIELQIANTYAAGGQYSEAVQGLRKLIGQNLGFDPSKDPDFAKLRHTAEFQRIMDEVRRQTPPVHNSRPVATLDDRDVRPENIALDFKRTAFLLGNTAKFELVRCSLSGHCIPFVKPKTGEHGYALGLKVNRGADQVWSTYNTPEGAALRCYDLGSGELLGSAAIQGKHVFNDLAISSGGVVYVTDTAEGSVYRLSPGTVALQRIAPQHAFTAANGISISIDGRLLYVSTWEDGLAVIDLQSGAVAPMIHPDDVCLAFTDGLYTLDGSLVAIQNGPMLSRIVEFRMSANRRQITAMRVLERRNPAFDGITTGVIVGKDLCYIANPHTGKQSGAELRPLQIFRVPITPQ